MINYLFTFAARAEPYELWQGEGMERSYAKLWPKASDQLNHEWERSLP